MNKRGLSGVIVTVLIILLALASITIVWTFVSPFLVGSDESVEAQVELFFLKLSIIADSVQITDDNNITFLVEREPGGGDVRGFLVVLEDSEGTAVTITKYNESTMAEFQRVQVSITNLEHNLQDIVKISVFAVIEVNEKTVTSTQPLDIYIPSGGGGGGGSPGGGNPPGPSCGNSVIESGEQCDDGNTNSGDGCSSTCQDEFHTDSDPDNLFPDGSNYVFIDRLNSNCDNSYTTIQARNSLTPWCDLFGADEDTGPLKFQPGDTILFKQGDYQHLINRGPGGIRIRSSGTSANRIRFTSYPGDNVTLRGGSYNNSRLLIFLRTNYTTVDSLNFKGYIDEPEGRLYMGNELFTPTQTKGFVLTNSTFEAIHGTDDINYGNHWPPDTPNKDVQEAGGQLVQFVGSQDSLVENVYVRCSDNPEFYVYPYGTGDGMLFDFSLNFTVRNSEFTDCGHQGLSIRRSIIGLVENNFLHSPYHTQLGLWTWNTTVRDNTIANFVLTPSDPRLTGNGMQLGSNASYNRIYNNVVYNSRHYGAGIVLGGQPENNDTLFENYIVNNVIYNMGESGVAMGNIGAEVGWSAVFNNTFANNIILGINLDMGTTGELPRWTLYAPLAIGFEDVVANNAYGNNFSNNFLRNFDSSDQVVAKVYGGVNQNYTAVTLNSNSFASGNLDEDPSFIDAANGDFRLQSSSPAIDSGVFIPEVHCATAGQHPGEDCVEWAGNAPDVGAFEFGL